KDGTYTIYFRPDGQGAGDWYYGYFYAQKYDTDTLTVTFKKGDVTVATVQVEPGATVGDQMPEEPVAPEDKIFADWRVGSDEGALFTADSFVTSDTTVVARFVDKVTVIFDPNTEENGGLANILVDVAKGEAIGDKLPTVPTEQGYTTKWVRQDDETVGVTAETVASESFTAVVAKEVIIYTVTFVQEDGTPVTRETSVTQGFAVNDLPAVTPKEHQVGKWVYPGTTNEFTVGTRVFEDTTVYAYYEQNVFTVTFMDGDKVHAEFTTASGTTIVLPTDPVRTGATFSGWFTQPDGQGTPYTASSTVSEDLTLYAYFKNQVRVRFLVKDDQGNIISEKSQYFVDLSVGDTIETLPDDPFLPGKVFDHWKNESNDTTVTVGYTVTASFDAVAVFTDIEIYELTMYYYYMNGSNEVEVGTQVYEITKTDVANGFTVTAPNSTIATEIYQEPMYYPNRPTVTVTLEDEWTQGTDDQGNVKMMRTERVEYVAADAEYQVKHWLKDLNGDDFTELIDTVGKTGVKNSVVTPEVNNYAFAKYDHRDENVTIKATTDPKQVLNVYYTRRSFTLSYNVSGGEYIDAETAPYGTQITLPDTATRAGYTFVGWYTSPDYSGSAITTYTLDKDTVLYAKWTPAQSGYKIVYMIENANDNDYSYLATVNKTEETDSTVTMTAATAEASGTKPSELDTVNFTFKDSTTETVKADGTTVVTVRYSRNVYTLQGRYNNGNVSGANLSAKYGADITTLWQNSFGNGNNAQYSWSYTNENNDKFKSLTIMPSLSVRTNNSPANTIYLYLHNDNADYYQHLEYWLQNYTGEGVRTTTHNNKTYGLVKSIDMRYNYLSDTDDWYEIEGYT
ncbi:MAG: InlB B-repeat-containing protein, partial [Clostridia bacterium]|nr:InlB B-repeat-containing protein [Clostridia bacterium]